jgi:TolB-like protein
VAVACAGSRGPAAPDAARPVAPAATPAAEPPEAGAASYARIALFPSENLAGVPVPLRGIDGQIARALATAGLEVVTGDLVERFLERHRLRYTGGIDSAAAAAAHEELGVDGVLLVSIEAFDQELVPRLAVTMRLVQASQAAKVVWIDGTARTGDDSPGVLGLGVVSRYAELERRELSRLARSLVATLTGRAPASVPCPHDGRFGPRIAFRSPRFDRSRGYSVAVLPFVNETPRRRVGDLVALELARQFAAVPRLNVLEPGVVRERLLRNRVVMEGGVSVDAARLVLDSLHADLVLAGYVRQFSEGAEPSVDITVLVLERERGTIMWESTSHASGLQSVWFFDRGRISTATALLCRMARDAVDEFIGNVGG